MGKWHCDSISKNKTLEILGISDINPERCELAEKNGLKVYQSNDAVFADRDVDIVVVATPNDVHEQIVVAALNSNKNVICENLQPFRLSLLIIWFQ